MRRTLVACLALLLAGAAAAQGYPSRAVRIVVPFPPGGTSDILARTIGARLSESFGQPAVIDNRPGAGGNIAAEHVARSTPTATPSSWERARSPSARVCTGS